MMWMVMLFIYYFALISISKADTINLISAPAHIELEIAQGKVNGLMNKTVYHQFPYYSFRGIPYAKPNVGRNKFNVAVPLDSWPGVLDATKHGNKCAQVHRTQVKGDEDCLFLNVYTPDLNKTAGRAVMVFIHGGGFWGGSGDDWLYGPDFLVEKDVVLVTMNYRLGVIGFLNIEDASAPGNVGLKDQNLALKWVQKNIINFGGSPERVTIFGQGTGAASVHYHILSPMSKGLFKSAILQSGAAVNPAAFTYTPTNNAKKLANMLKINATDMTGFVDKLKNINLEDFPKSVRRFMRASWR
uniref:Carboxylesterase 14 n=1 Tax=Meteorus pulchricornis TaxID=51522 RepID=A0A4D6J6D7_9HYME|nr:carboxylesterase 14 [Meteorus pulchricornis]